MSPKKRSSSKKVGVKRPRGRPWTPLLLKSTVNGAPAGLFSTPKKAKGRPRKSSLKRKSPKRPRKVSNSFIQEDIMEEDVAKELKKIVDELKKGQLSGEQGLLREKSYKHEYIQTK